MDSRVPSSEEPAGLVDSLPARILFAFLLSVILLVSGCAKSIDPTSLEPRLATADPDSGTVGTLVVLSGKDFQNGMSVAFGEIQATEVIYLSSGTVLVYTPDGVVAGGIYPITVANPGSGQVGRFDTFRGVAPALSRVSGVSRRGGLPGSAVLLEGGAFGDVPGEGRVYFTGEDGRPVEAAVPADQDWADDVIVAMVPTGAVSGPVWVETPTGRSAPVAFEITDEVTLPPR